MKNESTIIKKKKKQIAKNNVVSNILSKNGENSYNSFKRGNAAINSTEYSAVSPGTEETIKYQKPSLVVYNLRNPDATEILGLCLIKNIEWDELPFNKIENEIENKINNEIGLHIFQSPIRNRKIRTETKIEKKLTHGITLDKISLETKKDCEVVALKLEKYSKTKDYRAVRLKTDEKYFELIIDRITDLSCVSEKIIVRKNIAIKFDKIVDAINDILKTIRSCVFKIFVSKLTTKIVLIPKMTRYKKTLNQFKLFTT
jgi:hypothetical protein